MKQSSMISYKQQSTLFRKDTLREVSPKASEFPRLTQNSMFMTSRDGGSPNNSPTKHVPSPISFHKQMKRVSITQGINANDERFKLFNIMPKSSSKYKGVNTPDFTKQSTKVTLDSFF